MNSQRGGLFVYRKLSYMDSHKVRFSLVFAHQNNGYECEHVNDIRHGEFVLQISQIAFDT